MASSVENSGGDGSDAESLGRGWLLLTGVRGALRAEESSVDSAGGLVALTGAGAAVLKNDRSDFCIMAGWEPGALALAGDLFGRASEDVILLLLLWERERGIRGQRDGKLQQWVAGGWWRQEERTQRRVCWRKQTNNMRHAVTLNAFVISSNLQPFRDGFRGRV